MCAVVQGRQAVLLSAKALRKPATAISPAKSCVPSNASGAMVSMIIARMAPAASACTKATVSGAAVANAIYNATGVRLRDYPMTPEKVLEGMLAAGL